MASRCKRDDESLRRFKSYLSHQYWLVAQLVERMPVKHDVPGSMPGEPANFNNFNNEVTIYEYRH